MSYHKISYSLGSLYLEVGLGPKRLNHKIPITQILKYKTRIMVTRLLIDSFIFIAHQKDKNIQYGHSLFQDTSLILFIRLRFGIKL